MVKDKIALSIFGAGMLSESISELLSLKYFSKVAIYDNDSGKIGKKIGDAFVESRYTVDKNSWWSIFILRENERNKLREQCVTELGLKPEKELGYIQVVLSAYAQIKFDFDMKRKVKSENDGKNVFVGSLQGEALGGVELYTMYLCDLLIKQRSYKVTYVLDHKDYSLPRGLSEFTFCYNREWKPFKKCFCISEIEKLVTMLYSANSCYVITSGPDELLLAACIVKSRYKKNISIFSVLHNDLDRTQRYYLEFNNHFRCINYFLGVSKKITNELIEKGLSRDQVSVITCPVACEEKLKRKYTMNKKDPIRLAFAGRLDGFLGSQKRMDLIIELIRELKRRHVNFVFDIAGEGLAREDMERQMGEESIDEVYFSGQIEREKIPMFWLDHDIYINLSDYEGHSISQMEAMANGTVPVLTDVSGARDDVEDGVSGFVVSLGDYMTAAEKIQYLDNNRALLPDIGMKAHNIIYGKATEKLHLKFWDSLILS